MKKFIKALFVGYCFVEVFAVTAVLSYKLGQLDERERVTQIIKSLAEKQ